MARLFAVAVARRRGVILMGVVVAAALVTPVQVLARLAGDTLQRDLGARNAAERVRAAQLGANLIDGRLRDAGAQLASLATRPTIQTALKQRDRATLARELGLIKDVGGFDLVQAIDTDGEQLARLPQGDRLDNMAGRDYFRGALTTNNWYASGGFVTSTVPQLVMAGVSYGVREGGNNLGVIFVGLTPERILASLEPIRIPGRELLVADRRQVLIASSDPNRVLLSVSDLPQTPRTRAGASGSFAVPERDQLVTFAPLRDSGWMLFLVDDSAVVLAPERRLEAQLDFTATTATVIALVIAALVSLLYAMLAEANRRILEASQRAALTDPLTGLYNRRFMEEQLLLVHSLAMRSGHAYSAVMIDVDGLKRVNDTYGHDCGDRALKAIATALREALRASDVPIRYGGDEFLAVLPDTGLDEALSVAARVRAMVRQEVSRDERTDVDVSAGVATWRPGMIVSDLLKEADEGLYMAKRSGRGRVSAKPVYEKV